MREDLAYAIFTSGSTGGLPSKSRVSASPRTPAGLQLVPFPVHTAKTSMNLGPSVASLFPFCSSNGRPKCVLCESARLHLRGTRDLEANSILRLYRGLGFSV